MTMKSAEYEGDGEVMKAVQVVLPVRLWRRVKSAARDERRLVSQQAAVLLERGLSSKMDEQKKAGTVA